jgi:hypothetical protein
LLFVIFIHCFSPPDQEQSQNTERLFFLPEPFLFPLKRTGMTPAQDEKQNDQMEMTMKKILSTVLAATAFLGAVSAASATPNSNDIGNDRLAFWQQFADRND